MKEEITNAQLFRFCAGETTVKENDRIAAWLDENPEEHQQRLNDVHSMYLVSILCDESEAKLPTRRSAWATSFRRYAAGIAAALVVGLAGSYAFFAFRRNGWAQQQTVIEAPAGQHVRISLNDGSEVDLNSGSRLIYPSIFSGKERRVKLVGEARFDVSHNEKQPFIVETFAYDVRVFQCDCRRGERPVLDGIVRRPCVRPQPSDQRAGRHGTQYGRPARKRLLVCGRT